MVIKIGILGLSEGNGHPFSFSSIINGYSDAGYEKAGWPVIHNYLKAREKKDFGINGSQVTHVWTQDQKISQHIADASLIPHIVQDPKEMIGQVDAIILARDDYETHFGFAMPYLKAGLPVFVDKPLSLDRNELKELLPYLKSGQLMSCSGMRYASELENARANFNTYGKIILLRAATLNDWEKYGIHMIDAILRLTDARPIAVYALETNHMSAAVEMSDGSALQIDALGKVPKFFHIDIIGSQKISSHDILDNFSMFKSTLEHFIDSIQTKKAVIPLEDTLAAMKLLIAAKVAKKEKRKVYLNEIQL